ncbi:ABC transporter permease [Massilia sp. YIM B04103]|uniref:ABC transporter permease n=1 Tax=Massilia sp. YIM B04103 TaxID=2963106 RepID=UPI002108FDE9|nr:ABC transporter permease [Massilia sp. YIM B04103]
MLAPILTIARYTLLEALRNRLLWVLAVIALAALGLSGFLHAVALTESRQLQAALLAALLRLSAVFLIATFVVTSMAREAHDKGSELLLALPLPRAAYLLGKLGGFCLLALLPALLFGALGLFFAPPAQAALWGTSLLCELWLVAGFALLCMFTLNHVLPALAATLGFYLLARSVAALQLIGQHSGAADAGQRAIAAGMDLLALVLPTLDRFTRSEWLVYHDGSWRQLAVVLGQTAVYLLLLAAAALFDLYRKEF